MRIELPSGAWAELLAPDQLRSKHVRIATRALSQLGDARIGSRLVDLNDAAIAIIVTAWSATGSDGKVLALPGADLEVLEDMDPGDYLMLLNHAFVGEVRDRVFDLMSERVDPSDHADPASPTGPSAESGPGLREIESRPVGTSGPASTKRRSTSGSPNGGAGPQHK